MKSLKLNSRRRRELKQLDLLLSHSSCPKMVKASMKLSGDPAAIFESFKQALLVWNPSVAPLIIGRAVSNLHLVLLASLAFEENSPVQKKVRVEQTFKPPNRVCGQPGPKIRIPGEDQSYDESRGS